jgi:hypothetical protein
LFFLPCHPKSGGTKVQISVFKSIIKTDFFE